MLAASPETVNVVNVATPLAAVTEKFVNVPVPVANDKVTAAEDETTTLFPESSTFTTTTGENTAPLATVEGWLVKTSCVAAPTVTLNGLLVADVNPALAPVNEKLLPASAEIVRLVNVATPATAAIDAFVSVPTPVARVSVTVAVDGITFPPPSSSFATTAGAKSAPEATVEG